jgi:hypothetical protein
MYIHGIALYKDVSTNNYRFVIAMQELSLLCSFA